MINNLSKKKLYIIFLLNTSTFSIEKQNISKRKCLSTPFGLLPLFCNLRNKPAKFTNNAEFLTT